MKRAASSPAHLHNKCKCAGEQAALLTWPGKVSNGSDKGNVELKFLTFSCKCAGELAALFTWSEKVSNGSDKGDVEQKILTFSLTLLSDTAI